MMTLYDLMEKMDENFSLEKEIDPKEEAAIRKGLNISPDFWENFFKLCNDPNLSKLLEVRETIIQRWQPKIREYLTIIENKDDANPNSKTKIIRTGLN